MIVDGVTKNGLDVAEIQRTSTSLQKIYHHLRQTYYQELFVRINDKEDSKDSKKKQKQQNQRKKTNKMLPELAARPELLTARQVQKYLTHKEFPIHVVQQEIPEIDPIHSSSKLLNRQLREIIYPNRINHLKLARYLSKRRSQEPCLRDPEDIMITKRAELFPTHRLPSRSSIADQHDTVKKKSMLTPIKQLIKIQKAKLMQVQLPSYVSFQDFSVIMREYHYFQIREECYQYKAYIGKGNNSGLIKRLLKDRGYWTIVEKYSEDVHFVWTQTKNDTLLKGLRRRELKTSSQEIKSAIVAAPHKSVKQQTMGIAKLMSSDMFKSIVGSYKTSKKLGLSSLIAQIKSKRKSIDIEQITPAQTLFLNHVDHASCIGNKKGLLYHMCQYYTSIDKNPFEVVPESIHLTQKPTLNQLKRRITFGIPCILKPASGTNRGNGISIHTSWASLHSTIQQSSASKSFVVQRYLQPFLYKNRKFDIRVWVLWFNGQAWWYTEGYLRTSSKEFNLKTCNRFVHLTNDAVQKKSEDYGKYQSGNKLSFADFQKYLNEASPDLDFSVALSQMKSIAKDIFKVASPLMNPTNKAFGYQLFGLDFMIDQNFKVWLIQANTNPCLETSCSLLNRLITNMLDGVLNLTIDVVFEPPYKKRFKEWAIDNFKFQLIYDQNQVWNEVGRVQQVNFETDQDEFQDMEEEEQ